MRKDLVVALVGIAVVIAIVFALGTMRPQFATTPSRPFSTKTGDVPGATPAEKQNGTGRVVMRVNGEPITEKEFDLFVQQAPEQMQAFYTSEEGRGYLAQELAKLKALEQAGDKAGYDKDPDVTTRLKLARANLLAGYTLQKFVADPTDVEMQAEYQKVKGEVETVEVSHILIAVQGGQVPARNGQPLSMEQAAQRAQQIEQQLAAGADFGKLAREYSDDTGTAQQGGLIGPTSTAALPPEVRSLKTGEVSKPVRTNYGIHIFKVGNRGAQSFDALKPQLKEKIRRDRLEKKIEEVKASAKVELDPSFFPPQPKNDKKTPAAKPNS